MIFCDKTNKDVQLAISGFRACYLKAKDKGDKEQMGYFLGAIETLNILLTNGQPLFKFDDGSFKGF